MTSQKERKNIFFSSSVYWLFANKYIDIKKACHETLISKDKKDLFWAEESMEFYVVRVCDHFNANSVWSGKMKLHLRMISRSARASPFVLETKA